MCLLHTALSSMRTKAQGLQSRSHRVSLSANSRGCQCQARRTHCKVADDLKQTPWGEMLRSSTTRWKADLRVAPAASAGKLMGDWACPDRQAHVALSQSNPLSVYKKPFARTLGTTCVAAHFVTCVHPAKSWLSSETGSLTLPRCANVNFQGPA